MSTPRLLVVAGEVSGDIHAANMLEQLQRLRPGVECFGVGGERLREVGLSCIASSDELSHMGLVEVVRELPGLRRLMARVVDEARRRAPEVAVLVDSPDFNLRLARRLRAAGISVVLYVSPQIWAWRRGRVRLVRRVADEVLCILPFEVGFYESAGVPARYVGHPLVDEMAREGLVGEAVSKEPGRLALLPGSRAMEVRQLLPTMIEGLRRLPSSVVDDAVLVQAPGMAAAVEEVLAGTGADARLRRVGGRERRHALAASRLAWTASGTATLECALLDVPPVVGYRLQPLSFLLARMLVRVPHVALVNLIAGRRAVPELMQGEWNPDQLVEVTRRMLVADGGSIREALAEVRGRLGRPGARRRAAAAIAARLDRNVTPGSRGSVPREPAR